MGIYDLDDFSRFSLLPYYRRAEGGTSSGITITTYYPDDDYERRIH